MALLWQQPAAFLPFVWIRKPLSEGRRPNACRCSAALGEEDRSAQRDCTTEVERNNCATNGYFVTNSSLFDDGLRDNVRSIQRGFTSPVHEARASLSRILKYCCIVVIIVLGV